jgi:hypothetical protein
MLVSNVATGSRLATPTMVWPARWKTVSICAVDQGALQQRVVEQFARHLLDAADQPAADQF